MNDILNFKNFISEHVAIQFDLSIGLNSIIAASEGFGFQTIIINIDQDILNLKFSKETINLFKIFTYSKKIYLKYVGILCFINKNSNLYSNQISRLIKLFEIKNILMSSGLILDLGPKLEKNNFENIENCVNILTSLFEKYDILINETILREKYNSNLGNGVINVLNNNNLKLCHYLTDFVTLQNENYLELSQLNVKMLETYKITKNLNLDELENNKFFIILKAKSFNDILFSLERLENVSYANE